MGIFQRIKEYFASKSRRNKLISALDKLKTSAKITKDIHFDKLKKKIELTTLKPLSKDKYDKLMKEIKDFCYKCNYCNKEIADITNKFKCQYCLRIFCEKHRLPESHKCEGNPEVEHIRPLKVERASFEEDERYEEDEED